MRREEGEEKRKGAAEQCVRPKEQRPERFPPEGQTPVYLYALRSACLPLSLLPSWPTCTRLFPHHPASQRPRPLSRTNALPEREATLVSLNVKSRPDPRLPLCGVNPGPDQDNTARCKSFPASCGHRFSPRPDNAPSRPVGPVCLYTCTFAPLCVPLLLLQSVRGTFPLQFWVLSFSLFPTSNNKNGQNQANRKKVHWW